MTEPIGTVQKIECIEYKGKSINSRRTGCPVARSERRFCGC
jgi:hypothetical protein